MAHDPLQAAQPQDMTQEALARYSPNDAKIAELAEIYSKLSVSGEDDSEGYKVVRSARLDIRSMRIDVERTRKELKADALRYSQAVDGEARRLTALLTPIEKHLQEQEDIVARAAERRKLAEAEAAAKKLRERMSALAEVGSPLIPEDVRELSDEDFLASLAEATAARDERIKAEAEAAAEREREAARLAEERAELDKQRAQAAEEAAKLAAEREAVEAERREQQRKADIAGAEERARQQAEAEAKRVAEQKAEADRKAAEEAARREAMRPTVDKLRALADRTASLAMEVPTFDGEADVRQVLHAAADKIRAIAAQHTTEEDA